MNLGGLWEDLVHAICRPYRIEYAPSELIGGRNGHFTVNRQKATREDFVITNHKEQKLQCSQWQLGGSAPGTKLPCVIYCHCNSGSRLDAEEAIGQLLPLGVRVFALDFTGSGLSDGEYVTLGANEVEDLDCLVKFIRQGGHTSLIGLWGRSMGAVTALLYCVRDPSVAAMVLDSPFSRLTDLMWEILEDRKIPLRNVLGGTALKLMRRSVRKRAGFDIQAIAPIDCVASCYTPALFAHATGDLFVKCSHTEKLHEAYAGDKQLVTFKGDHNSARPRSFYEEAVRFLARAMQLDEFAFAREAFARDFLPQEGPDELPDHQEHGHTHEPWDRRSLEGELEDPDLQSAIARSLQQQTHHADASSASANHIEQRSSTCSTSSGPSSTGTPDSARGLNGLVSTSTEDVPTPQGTTTSPPPPPSSRAARALPLPSEKLRRGGGDDRGRDRGVAG